MSRYAMFCVAIGMFLLFSGASPLEYTLAQMNRDIEGLRGQLSSCYEELSHLQEGAQEEEYEALLLKTREYKKKIEEIEASWKKNASEELKKEEDDYVLWDQEEITLGQLVMEYGSLDFLYVVPPDMANIKLNVHSQLPIPRDSWTDVLEIILTHNGIGAKKLNTYTKQLYLLKQDPSFIQAIVSDPEDLLRVPDTTRLFYIFSPPPEQAKGTFQFFERFADAKQTFVHQVGTKIAIVASKEEVQKLLHLHKSVWQDANGKISKVVSITKMPVKEMERILLSFFGDAIEKNRPPFNKTEQEGLVIFPMGQGNSLVLIGQEEIVDRAEKIVKETEEQLQNPAEMTLHLYTCRHSDPTDIAKTLEKVYSALLVSSMDAKESVDFSYSQQGFPPFRPPDGYAQAAPMPVAPPPLKNGGSIQGEMESGADHFIPDPKTGNLLMVVRKDVLFRIKNLLKQLDIPKKMVQIEVLLFERVIHNKDSFGLNLLRIGSGHNNVKYNSLFSPTGRGVFEYLFHKSESGTPALDFAYNFLMTQENIQFHAAPSVTTVNQTPATINIVEEISINNGAAPIDTNKGIAYEQSYTRQQYGINIIMTPTVHAPEVAEDPLQPGKGSVTLKTNISFDTPVSSVDARPLVHRRHIENEIRVMDGETVIIGGLRKKTTQDNEERIPFLGEIPGLAKLFGSTDLTDANTEMFFFITPKIIPDPQEALERLRADELKKRPGDIPEFLQRVVEARDKESRKFFEKSLKLFFTK